MNKLTGIYICILFSVSLASALYAGETVTYDFSNKFIDMNQTYYEIINNLTALNGLNVTINKLNLTIALTKDFYPDNFSLILFGTSEKEELIIVSSNNYGGCVTTWNGCLNGTAIKKNKYCYAPVKTKPNCTIQTIAQPIMQNITQTITKNVSLVTNSSQDKIIIDTTKEQEKFSNINWYIIGSIILGVIVCIIIFSYVFRNKSEFENTFKYE